MKVLIVDDDPLILRAAARDLRALGWTVETSQVPTKPSNVDVVLTDWQPWGPQMLELCLFAATPVVVMTGAPETVNRNVIVVEKPFTGEALDAALRRAR
jgi:DNA-binding response OmpR family regulator